MKRSISFWIGTILMIAFVAGIIIFAITKTKNYRDGAVITVTAPHPGQLLNDTLVTVTGNVQNASSVTLNDRKIFVTEKGDFSEKLIVPEGYTIITLSAEDRFNKITEKKVEFVVKK